MQSIILKTLEIIDYTQLSFLLLCYQTPQAPLVRNERYNDYGVDEFPLGTNAVVAVISYTVSKIQYFMILK